jgi:oxalate---CoA ligase
MTQRHNSLSTNPQINPGFKGGSSYNDSVLYETTKSQSLCIYQLIATQAQRNPDAVAIIAPGRAPLTYRHLLSQVDQVGQTLAAAGVGRNDRIAIVLPNGPEAAVTFLAVAARATSAPLNPAYRANEYDFYLSDLRPKAVVVQSGSDSPAGAVARTHGIPLLTLAPGSAAAGTFTLTGSEEPCPAHAGVAPPEDVALVLHTSGTTSHPKIVPLTHANICASAHNIRAALTLAGNDRCLNMMPLFHIHGLIGAVLSSLVAGASVVCTPGFYAPQFFAWLEGFRPTWYTAVPSMHQAILARASLNRDLIARCPLRFIRSSSSPLPPQVMVELEGEFNTPVIEAYGMTEAAHQIASNPLPPHWRKAGSVGVAAGPEVAIVDEAGHVLPPGETGEVVIRGKNVTSGYENNPAANQSAFVNGWFRTGDQGYLDGEGYLFLTGRLKEIINRGGEKIAPREIDDVLLGHPAVAQAVTFAVPDARLGEEVAVAVVLREHTAVTARELREFAALRLADFKVPRRVIIVEAIPKGPTGKVQRIGLAGQLGLTSPQQGKPGEKAEFVPSRTPLEEELTTLWAQVLGIASVGVNDNFFQLGGDSILATQLLARIYAATQVKLSMTGFFETPTVAGLAVAVTQKQAEKVEQEDMARLLAELEGLSDEAAQRLLTGEI